MKEIQKTRIDQEENLNISLSNRQLTEVEEFFEESFVGNLSTGAASEKVLYDKILKVSQQPRANFSEDPLNLYEKYRESDPFLFELGVTVLSAPATQVSVERSFSALKLLVSPHRTRLEKQVVDNLLIISLNREILSRVNFENLIL